MGNTAAARRFEEALQLLQHEDQGANIDRRRSKVRRRVKLCKAVVVLLVQNCRVSGKAHLVGLAKKHEESQTRFTQMWVTFLPGRRILK